MRSIPNPITMPLLFLERTAIVQSPRAEINHAPTFYDDIQIARVSFRPTIQPDNRSTEHLTYTSKMTRARQRFPWGPTST